MKRGMKVENIMKAEVEMNLNQTTLSLYLSEKYQDDYQIPMLKHNQIFMDVKWRGFPDIHTKSVA